MRMRMWLLVGFLAAWPALACAKPFLPLRVDAPPHPSVPGDVVHATSTFAGRGGAALFAQSWRPAAGDVRGVLVIMHGLRDHGDHYAAFATRLAERGYAVHAFDLRGHGRSAGRRVTVDSFDDYVADFDEYVASVRAAEPGKPLFVYGHSMGGAIVALWTVTRDPEVAGVILSAPALRIDVPPIAAAGILLAGTLTPGFGGLAPSNEGFSSDPAVTAAMDADPLIFQPAGPVATAAQLVGAIERFWARVDRLRAPLLLLHGTGDKLTAPAGSREIYARAPASDKTLRLYPGLYHDLVHEPKREQVIGDVLAWLDAHTGGPATAFAAPDATLRLPGEGLSPSLAVAVEAGYSRSDDDAAIQGGGGELRVRGLLGAPLGYGFGLDASAGGFDGFAYRVAAYPLGVAAVSRAGHLLTLGVGAGFADPGGAAGFAWELPIAVDAAVQLGAVRLMAWGRFSWLLGDAAGADPLQLGLAVRLGHNHRYWSSANAGTGPYLGVTLHDSEGARVYGVVLGLDLWGGG